MLYSFVFDEEINIYWDKLFGINFELEYDIYLNGKFEGTSKYTHYEFYDVLPDTEYVVYVVARIKDTDDIVKAYDEIHIKTQPKKTLINITLPPYNAIGDGKTDNRAAIQKALDDCTANDRVYIPRGEFLTGSLDMHSDSELYIDEGGVLLGSQKHEDYLPKRISRFEGWDKLRYSAMINAGQYDNSGKLNCKNIVIRGKGEIRGGGIALAEDVIGYEWPLMQEYIDSLGDKLKMFDRPKVIPGRLRPFLIDINNCDGLIISGLKIGYGACWNIHYTYCKNIVISKCDICSEKVWNGDGIDPDSSENSVIYDIKFNTGDDAIAIKSGKNPEGNAVNIPCKDLKIFHIRGVNGIAIGSELSGGIENVFVWDSEIGPALRGLRIKTTRQRGGYVRNFKASNVVCPDISISTIYNCNGDGESAGTLTEFENFYYENITVTGDRLPKHFEHGIEVIGFDSENSIKNITLKNIKLVHSNSGQRRIRLENVENIIFENVSF